MTVGTSGGALVVPAVFWKLLAAEGVRPELGECVRCGEPGPLVAGASPDDRWIGPPGLAGRFRAGR